MPATITRVDTQTTFYCVVDGNEYQAIRRTWGKSPWAPDGGSHWIIYNAQGREYDPKRNVSKRVIEAIQYILAKEGHDESL